VMERVLSSPHGEDDAPQRTSSTGTRSTLLCTCHNVVRLLWILMTLVAIVATGYGLNWLNNHDYETHELAWFAAGSFVFLTIPVSMWEIAEHLHHYTNAAEQKHVVRILWFVPIYAVDSYLAMVFKDLAIYINTARECYEAFVIYSFINYLLAVVNGYLQRHANGMSLQEALEAREAAGTYMHHLFPFNYMLDPWKPADFERKIRNGAMAYVNLRLGTTVSGLLAEWMEVYHEGEMNPAYAWFWIMLVNNFAQVWAMYCLIVVYHELHDQLEHRSPFGKFMSVKLVVFFSFWQSVAVALAVHFEVITENPAWTEYTIEDVSTGLQDFLICGEMFLAAICHKWVFSYMEYMNDHQREHGCKAYVANCLTMFDMSDVGDDAVLHVTDVVTTGAHVVLDTASTVIPIYPHTDETPDSPSESPDESSESSETKPLTKTPELGLMPSDYAMHYHR